MKKEQYDFVISFKKNKKVRLKLTHYESNLKT